MSHAWGLFFLLGVWLESEGGGWKEAGSQGSYTTCKEAGTFFLKVV